MKMWSVIYFVRVAFKNEFKIEWKLKLGVVKLGLNNTSL